MFRNFQSVLKVLSLVLVAALLACFIGAALHHHDDGASHHDCTFCILLHQIVGIFAAAAVLFLLAHKRPSTRLSFEDFFIPEFLAASRLKDRSPPFIK